MNTAHMASYQKQTIFHTLSLFTPKPERNNADISLKMILLNIYTSSVMFLFSLPLATKFIFLVANCIHAFL